MATSNFHARIERIQKAHAQTAAPKVSSVREPGLASIAASLGPKRRRHPIKEHLTSLSLGMVMGALAAVAQIGHSIDGSPWGPGSQWHELAVYPIMGSLAMAPVLILISLLVATRRPGFALFSLGYLSGVVIPLFI